MRPRRSSGRRQDRGARVVTGRAEIRPSLGQGLFPWRPGTNAAPRRLTKGSIMETRAPFVIVGAFVLAAIAAVFGFVYWLNNAGGIGKRETYHIVFNGPVPGLLVGAAVLF